MKLKGNYLMNIKKLALLITMLIQIFAFTACSGSRTSEIPPDQGNFTEGLPASTSTAVLTVAPTFTPAPTDTPAPTPTATTIPSPTPTFPIESAPLVLEPAAPRPKTPISLANAAQIAELARWEAKDTGFVVSPNGKYLAVDQAKPEGATGTYLYDLDTSTGLWLLPGKNASGEFTPDSTQFIDRDGQVWDTTSGALIKNIVGVTPENPVNQICFSVDGLRMTGWTKNGIQVWDFKNNTQSTLIASVNRPINLQISPDGLILAGAYDPLSGAQARLVFWNVSDGQEIYEYRVSPYWIYSSAFSPDNIFVVAGTTNGTAEVLLTDGFRHDRTIEVTEPKDWVTAFAFTPDGKILATADIGTVKLWNFEDGTLLATLETPLGAFSSYLTFTQDGASLVFGGMDTLYWFGIP
jgi:hypothetical protein